MADISGGRAHNGGARSGPMPSANVAAQIRTPRQIMNERNAREQRRQEEQKAEEQRRLAEERRKSAERRMAAVGGAPRVSQTSSQYSPDLSQQQGLFEGSRGPRVAGSEALGDPTGRVSIDYSAPRPRGPTVSQQEQPRVASTATAGARRSQTGPSTSRQPASSTATGAQQPQSANTAQRSGTSAFPHAFERWETLSSHWEGLTSYWLHKLERNAEEIKDAVPNAITLNRQITDLSAAGANLFHAVVELQRLRASSERKFQRWFFETRGENERHRELQGQLEEQLRVEREGREELVRTRNEAVTQAESAQREMAETRRELKISKEEARRAWEELGRRNQESLETAESLKRGQVTLVHGIQVRPHFSGPITLGSEDQQYYASMAPEDRRYYAQQGSPTNTDPFMEVPPPSQTQRYETGKSSQGSGTYPAQPSGVIPPVPQFPEQKPPPASAGSLGPSSRTQTAGAVPITADEAQRFYQHAPQETFLHSGPSSTSTGHIAPHAREDVRSEESYRDVLSEGETEYAIDRDGNLRRDANGQPITFRRVIPAAARSAHINPATAPAAAGASADDDDDYDEELAAHYASGALPEAPSVPSTSAAAMASYSPVTASAAATAAASSGVSAAAGVASPSSTQHPDYEGAGFGGWEAMQTRHHHPTRLSDVLEEEEERSSRRTGD